MNKQIENIFNYLLQKMSDGTFGPGAPLPIEKQLAEDFGTDSNNAHRAVNALEKHGLVIRKKRVGTSVSPSLDLKLVRRLLNEISRQVCVLYSMTPHWIHWDKNSFDGLAEEIEPKGYSIIYKNLPTSASGRQCYADLLNEIELQNICALVIFPDQEDFYFMNDNNDLLQNLSIPVFMLNRSGEPLLTDMVSYIAMDTFGDGLFVGKLLKRNNYRNIIMLNVDMPTFWSEQRYEGLKQALTRGDKDFPCPSNFTTKDEQQILDFVMQHGRESVVVAVNNLIAAQFIDYAKQRKLQAGKDFRVISFDDHPMYRSYNLTTLAVPRKKIGQLFGQMICDDSWLKAYRGLYTVKIHSYLVVRDTFKPECL
jgi:DNA-binding LacI/PurR family transcriptional regulator